MKRPPKYPSDRPLPRRHGVYRIDLPDEGEVLYRFYSETGGRVGSVQVDAAVARPQFDDAMERLFDFFGPGQHTPTLQLLLTSRERGEAEQPHC